MHSSRNAFNLPRFSSAAKHTGYTINAINKDSTARKKQRELTAFVFNRYTISRTLNIQIQIYNVYYVFVQEIFEQYVHVRASNMT